MEEEESGWKYIHGDVFRFPPNKSLFCSFVGTGTQVRFPAALWGIGFSVIVQSNMNLLVID